MVDFLNEYFIQPIWTKVGYNPVNTITYAIIAILAVYLIYRAFKGRIKIDEGFMKSILCFVLFGSTIRVVTDSIDTGVFKPITPIHQFVLDSHLWDYGYFTVTPGVYILTAALLLISIAILYHLKRMELLGYVGLALWLPNFLLLVPFMNYALYTIPIFALAFIPGYLAFRYFKDIKLAAIVAAQALDGAATFFIIDVFSKLTGKIYFEQHVLSGFLGGVLGTYFTFYLIKVTVGFVAAYLLKEEKMEQEDKNYIALALMIMGFAPGIRDLLRMTVGG